MGIVRAFLAIVVLCGHNNSLLPGFNGHFAVLFFFVISGFFMALVLNEKYQGKTPAFYAARYLKLWPTYAITFLLVILFLKPLGSLAHVAPVADIYFKFVSASLFLHDTLQWIGYQASTRSIIFLGDVGGSGGASPLVRLTTFRHMWSIGIELSFYLLAPLLARWPRRLLAAFVLSYLLHLVIVLNLPFHHPLRYRSPFSFLWLFLLGMLCYWAWKAWRPRLDAIRVAPAVAILLPVVATYALMLAATKFFRMHPSGIAAEPMFLLFGLLMILAFHWNGRNRTDRMIGEFSYPIYVIHYPIAVLLITEHRGDWRWTGILLAISVVGAAAALLLVDAPVERLRRRLLAGPGQGGGPRLAKDGVPATAGAGDDRR